MKRDMKRDIRSIEDSTANFGFGARMVGSFPMSRHLLRCPPIRSRPREREMPRKKCESTRGRRRLGGSGSG
jgi:hypothetical protein